MTLSEQQIKQAYADSITILFNGAIVATADDISPEVIFMVDKMISEIATCSDTMTELSFNLIFSAVTGIGGVKLLDSIAGYLTPTTSIIGRLLVNDPKGTIYTPIQNKLLPWVQQLQGNYRHRLCIATARNRYRSSMQLALLGL